jgi:hypothetical protein
MAEPVDRRQPWYKYWLLWYGIAVLELVFMLFVFYRIGQDGYRRYMREVYGFRELTTLCRNMISEKGPGVIELSDGPRVRSFADFFEYVSRIRPKDVSNVDAENPFPGILPGSCYPRMAGESRSALDKLIWNPEVFARPGSRGPIKILLRCNGEYVQGSAQVVNAVPAKD